MVFPLMQSENQDKPVRKQSETIMNQDEIKTNAAAGAAASAAATVETTAKAVVKQGQQQKQQLQQQHLFGFLTGF